MREIDRITCPTIMRSKTYLPREINLAKAVYNFLKLADTASAFDKSVIAEEIGMILIEAKKHNIYKTTLALAGLYLNDLERETRQRVQGNNNFIEEDKDAYITRNV